MKLDRVFAGLNISSMGLTAQRQRMNVIADNLANAETTKTDTGGPYRRKIIEIKVRGSQFLTSLVRSTASQLATTNSAHFASGAGATSSGQTPPASMEASEVRDQTSPRMVYDPGNPEANEEGYVALPNVNVVTEMVNMISASRAFEANVVAVNAAKNMAKDSLEI
jgi:flagellar basal-body rod protein FlgC